MNLSISSSFVFVPTETLSAECNLSSVYPIADNTCDGEDLPVDKKQLRPGDASPLCGAC